MVSRLKTILTPVGAIVGAVIAIGGYILEGEQVVSLGLPIWAWQSIGAFIFFMCTLAMVYGFQKRMEIKAKQEKSNIQEANKTETIAISNITNADVLPTPQAINTCSDWLKGVLVFNQKEIHSLVNGRIASWNFFGLNIQEGPYFEVHLQLFNLSIFTLDFKGIEGDIIVGGITCSGKLSSNSPQRAIVQGKEFYVIVTQWVLPEMAKKIMEAGKNNQKLGFDLSRLTLNIETVTEGHEGLKPYVKFDHSYTPDIATWLKLPDSHKVGYWP